MNIEYEATFSKIDKNDLLKKLKEKGAKLIEKEFIQIRKAFVLPGKNTKGFVRVRKENKKATMTLKIFESDKIEGQKEIEIVVDDFDNAVLILKSLGIREKAFQETRREIWRLNNVQIMIDTWPFLETFVEVEGGDEKEVRFVSEKLGFSWDKAIFGGVDVQYEEKYGVSKEQINNNTPIIIFNMINPFLNRK